MPIMLDDRVPLSRKAKFFSYCNALVLQDVLWEGTVFLCLSSLYRFQRMVRMVRSYRKFSELKIIFSYDTYSISQKHVHCLNDCCGAAINPSFPLSRFLIGETSTLRLILSLRKIDR